jgi:hypothetical protein
MLLSNQSANPQSPARSTRAGCWSQGCRLLLVHVLILAGLLVVWFAVSALGRDEETTPPPATPVTETVFLEERTLAPGEYRATFRLALAGSPQDFRQQLLSRGAAQITIEATDKVFVPAQVLSRESFPYDGSFHDFSAYFYVGESTPNVAFEVAQLGDVELQIEHFGLAAIDQSPTRILLVAGRGADNTGWRAFVERGSSNYGLVDGGQRFVAYMVETLPCGSLADRTRILADYINGLHVPDGSLKAIGHSAGGLDLRLLVGLAHENKEPYLSAARKLRKVYTVGTPHEGTALSTWAQSILARPLQGFLCIGEPLVDDTTPEAMAEFNEAYPWDHFEIDGRRVPFLAFSFQATCLPWWADPFGIIGRNGDGAVSVTSQQWGESDNPPPDLPWVAAHAPPLDLGDCVAERSFMDVLNWVLSDPVLAP